MIRVLFGVLFLVMALDGQAQKYVVDKGAITFFSEAPLENIYSENKNVASIINLSNGDIAFAVFIKDFNFQKKLMQQHFNERYMESEKFPKATFSGTIEGLNPSLTAPQQVMAKGNLTIHGVTTLISVPGTVSITGNSVKITAKFNIKIADYKIEIPKLLWENIAEEIQVTVEVDYKPQ